MSKNYTPNSPAQLLRSSFPCITPLPEGGDRLYTVEFTPLTKLGDFPQYAPIAKFVRTALNHLYKNWDKFSEEERAAQYTKAITAIDNRNETIKGFLWADKPQDFTSAIEKAAKSTDWQLAQTNRLIQEDITFLRRQGVIAELPTELAPPERPSISTPYSNHYQHPLDGLRHSSASARGIHHNHLTPLWDNMETFDLTPQRTVTVNYKEQCIVSTDYAPKNDSAPWCDYWVTPSKVAPSPVAPKTVVLGKYRREISTDNAALLDAHVNEWFQQMNLRGKLQAPDRIKRLQAALAEVNEALDIVSRNIELWEDWRSLPSSKRRQFAAHFEGCDINALRQKERTLDERLHLLEKYEAEYLKKYGDFDFSFLRMPSEQEKLEDAGYEVYSYAEWKDEYDEDSSPFEDNVTEEDYDDEF